MIFNWVYYAVCVLAGVALGVWITCLIVKHKHDQLMERIDKLHSDLVGAFEENARLRDNWGRTIELAWKVVGFNKELVEQADQKKRRG